jgi:triosephosphate isomerase
MKSHVKRLYVGSNLKMYKTVQQTVAYFRGLDDLTRDIPESELCLFAAASYTALYTVSAELSKMRVYLGAQDLFWEDTGPYTGAVSPIMLKECGVRVVQVGHSERRRHFGETDSSVNKKVRASLHHGFTTLICIGETIEEKSWNVTEERLRQQVKIALNNVRPGQLSKVWLAYEPVWAIGEEGTPATPEYANRMHQVIRDVLMVKFSNEGQFVPILYGGSVNTENAIEMIAQPEVDGLYIGRSAWRATEFNLLIRQVRSVWLEKSNSD